MSSSANSAKAALKAQLKQARKATARCYFDVGIDGKPVGRIVFELYGNICPKTTENFRLLCTGELGDTLSYRGVKLHRVVKGFMIQGGDIAAGTGSGPPQSIFGGMWPDENFVLAHDKPFLLSMANRGPDTNGSQFFITTTVTKHLDGKHVVFGKVVEGEEYVRQIENVETDRSDRPFETVTVMKCGELVRRSAVQSQVQKKPVAPKDESSQPESDSASGKSSASDISSESESSNSEYEREKRKKKKRKQRKDKKKIKKKIKHMKDSDTDESDSESMRKASGSESDLSENDGSDRSGSESGTRSHKRRSRKDRHKMKKAKKRHRRKGKESDSETDKSEEDSPKSKDVAPSNVRISASGKLVRGRGSLRYRSPVPQPTYRMGESYRDRNRRRYEHGRSGQGGQHGSARDSDWRRGRVVRGFENNWKYKRDQSYSRSGSGSDRSRSPSISNRRGRRRDGSEDVDQEILSTNIQARLDKHRALRREAEEEEKKQLYKSKDKKDENIEFTTKGIAAGDSDDEIDGVIHASPKMDENADAETTVHEVSITMRMDGGVISRSNLNSASRSSSRSRSRSRTRSRSRSLSVSQSPYSHVSKKKRRQSFSRDRSRSRSANKKWKSRPRSRSRSRSPTRRRARRTIASHRSSRRSRSSSHD
eukprot:CFRG3430T1